MNNTVCNNGENGILLLNSDHNNVTDTRAYNNTLDGINLTNSSWVTVLQQHGV